MREVKKNKKKWPNDREEDQSKNKISPWWLSHFSVFSLLKKFIFFSIIYLYLV